ncbi:MAG TPA: TIGR04283 family arsenosugar biosynthesis glycosyltransferase [Desulfuromonadales bacterium]|nr:TIGR04283 family arsenosugar biosynthesis glycosyltransferase [Desulfuromonadales bacterium]
MSFQHQKLLSIIIPVVNEAEHLPALLNCLCGQRGVEFEVVVADGASTDGTREKVMELTGILPFPLQLVDSARGRAKQLNVGADAARGEFLLFIHADTLFDETSALAESLKYFRRVAAHTDRQRVAGHFPLRFVRCCSQRATLSYFYYEAKSALDRSGCTHGDQGFLLSRRFWDEIGPFDETLPVLEDTYFAEKVRCQGRWVLLPAHILTSARRLEIEGLRPRQTLNALIMNFAAIGWDEFFSEASDVYKRQDAAERLRLLPFLKLVRRLSGRLPPGRRLRLWYRTGRYVASQGWQVAFFFDVCRAYRSGQSSGRIDTPILDRFAPLYEKATDNIPGRFAATILVWTWFQLTFLWCFFREND